MAISNMIEQQREADAQLLAENTELTHKQAKHVAFIRWLVRMRRIVGDLAQDVEPFQKG